MIFLAKILAPKSSPDRNNYLDVMRGSIVLLMIGYHLCFDSIYFGYQWFEGASRNMNDHIGWLSLRAFIVGSFIFISGLSLSNPILRKERKTFFYQHLPTLILGLSALFISITSYWIFPNSWIDFGVLHFFFVTRLLLPWLRPLSASQHYLLASVIVVLSFLQFSYFDQIPFRWIGFTTHKPATEDYVPLIPWLAVFLAGLALAKTLNIRAWQPLKLHTLYKPLLWIGQHSLFIYLIHQPILWGIFNALK